MKWNSSCALRTAQVIIATTVFLLLTRESKAIQLSIIESGPDSDTSVGVWANGFNDHFRGVSQLVSPSGDVFDSSSILDDGFFNDLLLQFNSVEEAIGYIDGMWQGTLATRGIPTPDFSDENTFKFSIEGITLESINRTVPLLVSPNPSRVVKNGETFLFGWDYVGSDEMPSQTSVQTIPQFDPIRGGSRSIISTPSPTGTTLSSGGTGTGDNKFSHTRTNVPGTDKNRFLYTLEAAEAALPLDVEITLGSHFSLEDKVTLCYTSGLWGSLSPRVELLYSRQIDPFIITLSTVPEPSSVGLVFVMVTCCALSRSHCIRQFGT